eukprot:IDg4630t1
MQKLSKTSFVAFLSAKFRPASSIRAAYSWATPIFIRHLQLPGHRSSLGESLLTLAPDESVNTIKKDNEDWESSVLEERYDAIIGAYSSFAKDEPRIPLCPLIDSMRHSSTFDQTTLTNHLTSKYLDCSVTSARASITGLVTCTAMRC